MTSDDAPVEAEAPAEPAAITFSDLGLGDAVLKALRDVGYETPSAIQAATIPTLLAGRDVVGLAQTGTGKTAAFALPILDRLDVSQKTPQALVLAPTRELALQVCEAFEKYASHVRGVHVLPVYGGQGYGVQLSALRRGVHIIVGTPGRIMDHLDKGTLDLSELKFLVLDEADEMLQDGLRGGRRDDPRDTPSTASRSRCSRRRCPRRSAGCRSSTCTTPKRSRSRPRRTTSATITQRYLIVSYQQKIDALTRILEIENFEGMIVFARTKSATEEVAEKLRARGYSAAAINGDIAQVQRERTVNQLKSGKLDILVATDVAARGLDVERISHVVNFDIPTDTESYVHRIGRTGRAGRIRRRDQLRDTARARPRRAIERATRQPLTQMQLPSVDDVNVTRLARFDDRITAALGETERIDGFRDIIAHYVRHHDVPEVDVAAALAVVAQGESPLLLEPDPEPRPRRGLRRAPRSRRPARAGSTATTAASVPSAAREPSSEPHGDVPHRGRQAPPRRAAADRRRTRERGRPQPRRLRGDPDPPRLLARRAARRPAPRDPRSAVATPASRAGSSRSGSTPAARASAPTTTARPASRGTRARTTPEPRHPLGSPPFTCLSYAKRRLRRT